MISTWICNRGMRLHRSRPISNTTCIYSCKQENNWYGTRQLIAFWDGFVGPTDVFIVMIRNIPL